MSLKEQWFGTDQARLISTYRLPQGEFTASPAPKETVLTSPVHCARLPLSDGRMSVPLLRRGVAGTLDDRVIRIIRPRYGLRRASRTILIDREGVAWGKDYFSSRRYRILRRRDGSVVMQWLAGDLFVDEGAGEDEAALALAIEVSTVISTSSLLSYVSL